MRKQVVGTGLVAGICRSEKCHRVTWKKIFVWVQKLIWFHATSLHPIVRASSPAHETWRLDKIKIDQLENVNSPTRTSCRLKMPLRATRPRDHCLEMSLRVIVLRRQDPATSESCDLSPRAAEPYRNSNLYSNSNIYSNSACVVENQSSRQLFQIFDFIVHAFFIRRPLPLSAQ